MGVGGRFKPRGRAVVEQAEIRSAHRRHRCQIARTGVGKMGCLVRRRRRCSRLCSCMSRFVNRGMVPHLRRASDLAGHSSADHR